VDVVGLALAFVGSPVSLAVVTDGCGERRTRIDDQPCLEQSGVSIDPGQTTGLDEAVVISTASAPARGRERHPS
jgi:hypothetical protein